MIVHGLNLVWKHDPYVPPATRQGFTARDARFLHRHGFNGARLGTLWAGATPDEPEWPTPRTPPVAAGDGPARVRITD